MKVVDLINDLFDYREFQTDKLPKKIRFNNKEFVFVDNSYYNENGINIMAYVDNTLDLRVEIEIIEEAKEIKTLDKEKDMYDYTFWESEFQTCTDLEKKIIDNICLLRKKQEELIKAVNELKKGK